MPEEPPEFEIEFNLTELTALCEGMRKAIPRMLEMTAQELWGNIRREAPTDHGRLAGSFTLSQDSAVQYRIQSPVEYALAVNDGSEAHMIYPKNKKALYWAGAAHPMKAVHHPGNKPNPYLDRAMDKTTQRLGEFATTVMAELSK